MDFITAPENTIFAIALAVMLIIALLEGVGALFGAGLSTIFAAILPDIDVDVSVESPDVDSPTLITRFLAWLRVGEVPLIVILIAFLTSFGLVGLTMQQFLLETLGIMLPSYIAIIPACLAAFPFTRVFAAGLGRILPKDETSAVSKDTFIGRIATITLGQASRGNSAQARVKDSFGQSHYIMVEPDNDDDIFSQGTELLLVRQNGAVFYAIENTHDVLKGEAS